MDSELEDCNGSKDLQVLVEMNGHLKSPQKNGNHDGDNQTADQNSLLPDEHIGSNTSRDDTCAKKEEDPLSMKKANKTTSENKIVTGTVKVNNDKEKRGAGISDEGNSLSKPKADTNGDAQMQTLTKDGKPLVQRRMSLRSRAMPKKYADAEACDEEPKDPLATKDPLEIPLCKSTVLIRNAPTPSQLTVTKSPNKSPIKLTKVIRPPPELIKAPIANKISISSATSVTIVPRAKENHSTNNSGYVVVDTQSILKGKTSITASTVPASVTVSAVPSLPKSVPKLAPTPVNVSTPVNKKTVSSANSSSLPDPFESLGLADDSFIVEAPSFVVPYLIEKVALEDLKKTVETLKPPHKKKKDMIELSEEDSNDSETKSKEETKTPDGEEATPLEKSSMKSEIDKSAVKNKEEEEYFTGPIGRFFLDIGLSLVQEYVQGDLLRVQKRKFNKGTKISDPSLSVNALSKGLDITRAKNDPYRLPWRHCDKCNFKSESKLILAHHWSLPLSLGSGPTARYGCHWCSFEAKESHLVIAHIESEHGMKSRLGPDLPPHQCPLCPFEDNVKSKVTRHVISCQKRFIAERNLEPPLDWEPPAKIPRMPTRGPKNSYSGGLNAANSLHGYALATAKGLSAVPYHPLLPKSALMNTMGYSGLSSPGTGKSTKGALSSQANIAGLRIPNELHVVQGATHRGTSMGQGVSSQSKTPYRQQPSNQSSHYLNPSSYAVPSNQIYQAIAKSFQLLHGQGATMSVLPSGTTKHPVAGSSAIDKLKKSSNSSSISLVSGLVNTSGLTIQSSTSPSAHKSKTNQQPSISITPLPRSTTSSASTNKPSLSVTPVNTVNSNATASNSNSGPKAGQPTTPGQKGGVVCEICDGSIKDLEQLRHHMQWIHKVKIHPKMIHNRPPLNCQKCQCRFFTDQGLERHLLGSHGLVTSSMQEAANRGQDGGRCPICGKVHQWKLLSHVVKDHGLSLKPAHLSYKCTVCTATFTMYKLFENHVYTAHSVVARKVLDKEKLDGKKCSGSNAAGALRINDEITIIPQTARHDSSDQNVCRPSKGEKRNRVDIIDLSDDEDNKDGLNLPKSQVTITKVPAPKGFFSKNSREPLSKRSRTEDFDTE